MAVWVGRRSWMDPQVSSRRSHPEIGHSTNQSRIHSASAAYSPTTEIKDNATVNSTRTPKTDHPHTEQTRPSQTTVRRAIGRGRRRLTRAPGSTFLHSCKCDTSVTLSDMCCEKPTRIRKTFRCPDRSSRDHQAARRQASPSVRRPFCDSSIPKPIQRQAPSGFSLRLHQRVF